GGRFTVGHGLEIDALREAGIAEADVFIASTDGDNTNLTIAQGASKQFGVPKVIVRVMDPARAEGYAEPGLHTIRPTKYAVEEVEEVGGVLGAPPPGPPPRRARRPGPPPASSDLPLPPAKASSCVLGRHPPASPAAGTRPTGGTTNRVRRDRRGRQGRVEPRA